MRPVVVLAVLVLLGAVPAACGGSAAAPTATPAATATTAASPTPLATATEPPPMAGSGQLAFAGMPEGASASAIYLVGSDGTGLRAVWTWETAGSQAGYLVWSPDGRQLAFFGHESGTKSSGLYVLDVDQGSLTRVLEVVMMWYPPVWSPDGRQLYVSASSLGVSGIWVVPADGSAAPAELIAEQGKMETPPRVSPDGQQVAASVLSSSGPRLAVTRVDDPQMRVVIDDPLITNPPVWSPDSRQIAFIGLSPDGIEQLYVVNADGTGLSQLTDHQPPDAVASGAHPATDPAWSPDGHRIAYSVRHPNSTEVFLAAVDGSDTRNLSNDPEHADTGPSWSPDGREVAFVSQTDIRVIMADGTHLRTVVEGFLFGAYVMPYMELVNLPAWRPAAP